ncbi:MAG: GNAT family N-acetyltransferase [Myxococcales bacterium]|nr:GNAT family N-acetyltransferase [Myxococcales bacterium]
MSVQLRSLSPSDRPVVEGILRSDQTFRDDEVEVALDLVDDALSKADSDYWFRIASSDGQVAGYICFGPTPMTACTYDLYWIVVHAEHRGKGLARTLIADMEAALAERGGAAQVRVETSQSEGYGAARKLYENLGYPETARFRDFYSPGDDLIVFYKSL